MKHYLFCLVLILLLFNCGSEQKPAFRLGD